MHTLYWAIGGVWAARGFVRSARVMYVDRTTGAIVRNGRRIRKEKAARIAAQLPATRELSRTRTHWLFRMSRDATGRATSRGGGGMSRSTMERTGSNVTDATNYTNTKDTLWEEGSGTHPDHTHHHRSTASMHSDRDSRDSRSSRDGAGTAGSLPVPLAVGATAQAPSRAGGAGHGKVAPSGSIVTVA